MLTGFCRYQSDDGPAWGVLQGDVIYPCSLTDVSAALNSGSGDLPAGTLEQPGVQAPLLPPLLPGARIFCVGLNFGKHVLETGLGMPEHPVIFTRFADSLVGHGQPMLRPVESREFDYEGEVALVIGKPGRRIAEVDAMEHVAGYTLANDGSVRDWQFHTHQFLPGKTFTASGALGPAIWPAGETDLSAAQLETIVSGETLQSAPLSDMIFSFERLIAYLSGFTTLQTGDVILTGTPDGVGFKREPNRYLVPGDTVEVRLTGLPALFNPVEDEQPD